MTIETTRLNLISCDINMLEAAIKSNDDLAKVLGVKVPQIWTEFGISPIEYSLQKLTSLPEEFGWWTYFPIHVEDGILIGSCGYKGAPDSDGNVEIGYEIIPSYRSQGLATEVASGLIASALANQSVNRVIAHTLGQTNASTSVLTKCGFIKTIEINDPDDGLIWRWELMRP